MLKTESYCRTGAKFTERAKGEQGKCIKFCNLTFGSYLVRYFLFLMFLKRTSVADLYGRLLFIIIPSVLTLEKLLAKCGIPAKFHTAAESAEF